MLFWTLENPRNFVLRAIEIALCLLRVVMYYHDSETIDLQIFYAL